jgi:hypothetical protein
MLLDCALNARKSPLLKARDKQDRFTQCFTRESGRVGARTTKLGAAFHNGDAFI